MNQELLKRIGLVVVIVAAVGFVAFQVYGMSQVDKPIVDSVVTLPADYKSEKEKALEAQASAGQPIGGGKEEPDLGGDMGGGKGE
jgi:hypothetical protein